MFKFGFSGDDTQKNEVCEADSVIWEPCGEVSSNEILAKHEAGKSENALEFVIGSVVVKCLPLSEAISEAVNTGSEKIKQAENSHSDLIPGVYEGGLKVWECTNDLADYLASVNIKWPDKTVLDLGCGGGLLGIFTLAQGARVVFQDYNREVLETFTGRNVLLNNGNLDTAKFYYGDWASFSEYYLKDNSSKFDVILTSETIYNPENYKKLHDVISNLLSASGICYLAAKSVYFGVGGSTQSFISYVLNRGKLEPQLCSTIPDGINREIYSITFNRSKDE